MPIDAKTAVNQAITFVKAIMQDDRSKSVLLEEVELSEDGNEWHVTISVPQASTLASAFAGVEPRDYRTVRVNSVNGAPISMKYRKL
jgi:hypothetical protein